MEVRSNAEKCGNDAVVTTAVAAATTEATASLTINHSMELNESTVTTRAAVEIDPSRTMVNDDTKPPLTRDEKLVADLKSQIPDVDNIFKIHRRIGEGTFSTVFLTSLRGQEHLPNKRLFALKYLIPTSHPRRIAQELRCLKDIGGKDNVIGVDLCLRNKDAIAFVMPYMPHDRFHDYFDKMNVKELQEYMGNLLIALRRVHEFNVIHRDVKPSNFLHDRKNHKFLLVDFGLAQSLDKETTDIKKSIKATCKESDKSNNKPNEVNIECDNSEQFVSTSQQPSQAMDCKMSESSIESTEKTASTAIPVEEMTVMTEDNCVEMTDVSCKSKRKLSDECDESENQCATVASMNPKKRQRTLSDNYHHHHYHHHHHHHQSTLQNNENTSQHPHGPYIPSSQFKTPLKQMNEISNQKQQKRGITEIHSPLSADIKSTILTYSIGSKIESQRKNINTMSPIPKLSSGQMVTPKASYVNNVSDQNNLNTSTPVGRKYNVDNRNSGRNVKCFCYGRPTVCNICLVKKEIQATRAGTPGYRPTEVLLKYPNQTTAVDCWAAGVILISILSGCYPFFKSRDDYNALAEIITVFGDEIVKKTAHALGRNVCISHKKRPLHLRKLCIRLRNRQKIQNTLFIENTNSTNLHQQCDNCEQKLYNCLCQDSDYNTDFSNDIYPESVYDLLVKLLAINPYNRISAKDALEHAFFQEVI